MINYDTYDGSAASYFTMFLIVSTVTDKSWDI